MTDLSMFVLKSLASAAIFSQRDLRNDHSCSYISGPLKVELFLNTVESDTGKAFELTTPMIDEAGETACINLLRNRFPFAELRYVDDQTIYTWRWE